MTPEEKVEFDDWLADNIHRLERMFINYNSKMFADFIIKEYSKVLK